MDYEHQRLIEQVAAQESEISDLRQEVESLRSALGAMNAVARHQLNEVFESAIPGMKAYVHPLTCGRDSNHTVLFPFWTGERVVLRCPDCEYEQTHVPVCVAVQGGSRGLPGGLSDADGDVGC
jgi:hypothetical protein